MNSEKQLAKFVTAFAMLVVLAVPVHSAHADTFALGAMTPFADISISSPSPAPELFSDVFSFSSLLAGTGSPAMPGYEIRTSDSVVGAFGSYGGNLVVLPIPEPEIFAMILAGLGLMGFVVRRRRL